MTLTNVILTAYCSCQLCCGPAAPRPTASGVWPTQGTTIAAPRYIPFGTVLTIPGIGRRTVHDRTARRFGNRFDLFFARHSDALRFGKRTVTITIHEPRRNSREARPANNR